MISKRQIYLYISLNRVNWCLFNNGKPLSAKPDQVRSRELTCEMTCCSRRHVSSNYNMRTTADYNRYLSKDVHTIWRHQVWSKRSQNRLGQDDGIITWKRLLHPKGPVTRGQQPRQQSSWGQHGTHLGSVGPRWAPCWPHEPCYQGKTPTPCKRRTCSMKYLRKCA